MYGMRKTTIYMPEEGATATVYVGGIYEKTGSVVRSHSSFAGQTVAHSIDGSLSRSAPPMDPLSDVLVLLPA